MTIEQYFALKQELEKTLLKYRIQLGSIMIIGVILLGVCGISASMLSDENLVNSIVFSLSAVLGSTMLFGGIALQMTLLNGNHKDCSAVFHSIKKLNQLYKDGKTAEESAKVLNLLPGE